MPFNFTNHSKYICNHMSFHQLSCVEMLFIHHHHQHDPFSSSCWVHSVIDFRSQRPYLSPTPYHLCYVCVFMPPSVKPSWEHCKRANTLYSLCHYCHYILTIARGPTLCTHFANLRLAPNHQRQLLTVISYLIPISIKTNYISIFWPLLHILMGFPTIWPALILSVRETFEVKTVSVVISKAPISDQLWLTRVDIGTVNFLPQTNFGLRSFPLKATFLSKLVPRLTRCPQKKLAPDFKDSFVTIKRKICRKSWLDYLQ